jgi:hypothetical protein
MDNHNNPFSRGSLKIASSEPKLPRTTHDAFLSTRVSKQEARICQDTQSGKDKIDSSTLLLTKLL